MVIFERDKEGSLIPFSESYKQEGDIIQIR